MRGIAVDVPNIVVPESAESFRESSRFEAKCPTLERAGRRLL
jgi:hypothetical protein